MLRDKNEITNSNFGCFLDIAERWMKDSRKTGLFIFGGTRERRVRVANIVANITRRSIKVPDDAEIDLRFDCYDVVSFFRDSCGIASLAQSLGRSDFLSDEILAGDNLLVIEEMGQVTEEPFVIYEAQVNNTRVHQKIWPVYELIRYRINRPRPFIVTTSLSIEDMRRKYGVELVDELEEMFGTEILSVKL